MVKYHYIRQCIVNQVVTVKYLQTDLMLADIFTKALAKDKVERFSNGLGLQVLPRSQSGSVEGYAAHAQDCIESYSAHVEDCT